MIQQLQNLLKFESITNAPDIYDPIHGRLPYGKDVFQALEYTLDLCKSYGFKTKNCDNYLGYAEIGEGKTIIGILAHLDVVPAGDGWSYPPFDGTVVGDRLYGRGSVDNKGPIIAVIHAMKAIKESGIKIDKRIRLILGCQEESGDWEDIKHYLKTEEAPSYGFTPDADFPAIYGEKGILLLNIKFPLHKTDLVSASGGTAVNVVPSTAQATTQSGQNINGIGKSAHGSMPEHGVNAIAHLFSQINTDFAEFYNRKLGYCIDGSNINCGFEDEESGKLSLNVGTVSVEDNELKLEVDIRYPISVDTKEIIDNISTEVKEYDGDVQIKSHKAPVFMDKESPVIQSLISAYQEITQDNTPPVVIGGGTYARAMNSIVAFGPVFPNMPCTEHMANEYITITELNKAMEIYTLALSNLLKMEDNHA